MGRDKLSSATMSDIRKALNCGDPKKEARARARLDGIAKYDQKKGQDQ